MKYLLMMGLVFGIFWLWRHIRQAEKDNKAAAARPSPARNLPPVTIVACAVCGVHLPQADALTGRNALYCCDAHRRQAEA